jgi:hypothetical protein
MRRVVRRRGSGKRGGKPDILQFSPATKSKTREIVKPQVREKGFQRTSDPKKLPPAPARQYSEGLPKIAGKENVVELDITDVDLLPEYQQYVEENYPPAVWDSVRREFVPALLLFDEHVEKGLIKDEKGRMLSPTEIRGLPPGGAFLNVSDRILLARAGKAGKNIPYYPGLVVKICGDYRPDLADDHNTWAVITKVLDPYRYEAVSERTGEKIILRDYDIKAIIGDYEHDYIGIGKDRHKREVKPLIEDVLREHAE